jgi:peroxiredoxin
MRVFSSGRVAKLTITLSTLALALALTGCDRKEARPEPQAAAQTTAAAPQVAAANAIVELASAKLGAEAPDFELKDLDGNTVKLSSFRGKPVVLEWFNPGCPFVKASHTKGSLVSTATRHQAAGVTRLAINSSAPGKQGHGVDTNREARATFKLSHPILLDEAGRVGKAYDAKRTPHLYVIDKNGVLVYRGAIDNSPDGEGESPKDGKLVNYVDAALADLAAGKPVAVAETESYGCSVKYAN